MPPLSNDCLAAGALKAKLQGAVMRTNLIVNNNLDACVTSQFYVSPPVNEYLGSCGTIMELMVTPMGSGSTTPAIRAASS